MAVMKETLLQRRIQKLIRSRGGYVHKNWGNMTSEPGIADLTVCYKGYYIAIEVKEEGNVPSKAQGVHARQIWKAGGIACVVWTVEHVDQLLNAIDVLDTGRLNIGLMTQGVLKNRQTKFDDGTRW